MPRLRTAVTEKEMSTIPRSTAGRALRSVDIEDLTTMIWQTLKLLRKDLDFTPAFPQYLIDSPQVGTDKAARQAPEEVITWSIIQQEPASRSGERWGGTRDYCKRVREELIPDPSLLNGEVLPSGE